MSLDDDQKDKKSEVSSYNAGPVDVGLSLWERFSDAYWAVRLLAFMVVAFPFALLGYWQSGEASGRLIKGLGFVIVGALVWLDHRQKQKSDHDTGSLVKKASVATSWRPRIWSVLLATIVVILYLALMLKLGGMNL